MGEYRYCPRCGTEYRQGFEKCAECDVALVDDPPATAVAAPAGGGALLDPDIELVEVYRSGRPDAEMVRSYLEGHGIAAIDVGSDIAGYSMTVGPLGEGRIYVRAEQEQDARSLIRDVWGEGPEPAGFDEEPMPGGRLGFSTTLLIVIAIVIVVGIVLAYMPGS